MLRLNNVSPLLCAFIAFVLITSGCASGQVKTAPQGYKVEVVEAEGLAPLGDDLGLARKNAINEAQKRAVESVVGVYVSAASLVSKAQMLEDNITSQTEGYIQDYKIIKEKKDNDFYKVSIKAWVKSEDLSKKLSEMDVNPKKYGNPLMSFWINEKIDSQSQNSHLAELSLMKSFVDAGFVVSDQKPQEYYSSASAILNDNTDNLQKLKADIVVIGDADSTFNTDQGLGGLVSYRANLSLKILMTATKEIITTKNTVASGIDINKPAAAKKALEEVAQKVSIGMPDEVLKYLKERAFSSIVIKNVKDIAQVKKMINSIKTFPTVKDCWVKNYSEGVAVISLDLKRGALDEVSKMLTINENFNIKIANSGKYEIEAEILSEKK
ncbi:MAG: hypothetical protein LHV68_03930 [Elusimicrobia bacterium]|nr:hypothetical protein [Candidatus Liberimonas magnetica]